METAVQKKKVAQNGVARKVPTLRELILDSEQTQKENELIAILNQPPPEKWLGKHPTAKIKNDKGESVPLPYLPINKIEFLLTRIYRHWHVEIRSVQTIANSVVVTVRLYVVNPLTEREEWHDGVGASPIQTDAGAGAVDLGKVKTHGVMIAAPAAETYAIKDAAEKFGKVFGRDLGRTGSMDYNVFIPEKVSLEDLTELYELKKGALSESERTDAERIINTKEFNSYNKLKKLLSEK
jgi:hypothetical protein